MGNRVTSIPSPGIRSLNDVAGNGQNVDIVSGDGSVVITPDALTKTIDIRTSVTDVAGTVIPNVDCDSTCYVGAAIRMESGIAVNALADSVSNSNVFGFVESKVSSTVANIRVLGVSGAIFSSLDESKEYYLSSSVAGEITITPPTAPGHVVLKLGQPFSATKLLVLKGTRFVRS